MAQTNVVTGGWRSVSAAKRAGVAGPSHRNVDHRATRAKAAVLFGREIVVGELQLEGDVRPEKHASVQFPGAVRAGRALRLPAVLRRVLDLFALGRPAADGSRAAASTTLNLRTRGAVCRFVNRLSTYRLWRHSSITGP